MDNSLTRGCLWSSAFVCGFEVVSQTPSVFQLFDGGFLVCEKICTRFMIEPVLYGCAFLIGLRQLMGHFRHLLNCPLILCHLRFGDETCEKMRTYIPRNKYVACTWHNNARVLTKVHVLLSPCFFLLPQNLKKTRGGNMGQNLVI